MPRQLLATAQAYRDLAEHVRSFSYSLKTLYNNDSVRRNRLSFNLESLTINLASCHINDRTMQLLLALAEERQVALWRDRMARGEIINNSEKRAVLHMALRNLPAAPLMVDGHDVCPFIGETFDRMRQLSDALHNGTFTGTAGDRITDVINVGIGGSDLGARLVVNALANRSQKIRAHFVANIDPSELDDLLPTLNPLTTLVVVVSKTFTTQETLMNALSLRDWLLSGGAADLSKHMIAVTARIPAAVEAGVSHNNILPIWDWIGGRVSLWSAVGLIIPLVLGWYAFKSLHQGAAAVDANFCNAPLEKNLPVLLALSAILYRNFYRTSAHAIIPYSERLRDLPRWMQQLSMESNGKSITSDGLPVGVSTAPIIFGECGTIGQHSFHQLLHQGTDLVPVDFIGVRNPSPSSKYPQHHKVLLDNMMAQARALREGETSSDPARTNPGNRPSNIIWIDELNARNLGMLLALYEHKVFVEGIIWGVNPFDQWGVELGKRLAKQH